MNEQNTTGPISSDNADNHSADNHSPASVNGASFGLNWGPVALPAIGAVIWLAWALIASPAWTVVILMMSPFVLVPMGLALAGHPSAGPTTALLGYLRLAAIPLALPAAIAFSLEAGLVAAVLTLPWLGFTTVVALVGLFRFLSRRRHDEPGIGVDAGLAFIVVGGAWLTITRMGANPLGFSDTIVRLTAVHFHYAGFALPLVAGLISIRSDRSWRISLATIVGVPLTAIGITTGGLLEWFAATVMALAGIAVAFIMVRHANEVAGWPAQLLRVAGVTLFAGMGMALLYSWSNGLTVAGVDNLSGPTIYFMVRTHGSLNAFGFGLLALIALTATPAPVANDPRRVAFCLGRPSTKTLTGLQATAAIAEPPIAPGLLHREIPEGFRRDVWTRETGDFEAAKAAITNWAGHSKAGIARVPERAPIEVGQTLALAIPVGPIAVTATSRIVEVIDEPDRFGFAYLALGHHPEQGEESFIVHRGAGDNGRHLVKVTAVWATAGVASDLVPPLTRFLQRRAINRYLDGIVA